MKKTTRIQFEDFIALQMLISAPAFISKRISSHAFRNHSERIYLSDKILATNIAVEFTVLSAGAKSININTETSITLNPI